MFLLKHFWEKIRWDKDLPPEIKNIWLKREKVLPSYLQIPRLITSAQKKIREIELLLFRDASIIGASTFAYTVIHQTSSTTQGFISGKPRLSKKNTSIPRLELIAAVMVENLAGNITNSLQRFKVTALHGWSDSMVVLLWLKINGTYKQFVQNRVNHIKLKAQIQWHFVSTDENSRGCNVDKLPKRWLERTTWFQSKEKRQKKNDIEPTKELEEGAKLLKEVFCKEKLDESQIDVFINKFEFWKTIGILSWIKDLHTILNRKRNKQVH